MAAQASESRQLVRFRIGAQQHAVDIMRCVEIVRDPPPEPLTELDRPASSLLLLRGHRIPCVDLGEPAPHNAAPTDAQVLLVEIHPPPRESSDPRLLVGLLVTEVSLCQADEWEGGVLDLDALFDVEALEALARVARRAAP